MEVTVNNITTTVEIEAGYDLFEVIITDLSDENIEKYAIQAAQSAANALASANLAEADKIQTGLDRAATGSDRIQTGLDAEQTALDRIATGQDRLATASDRVQTGLDRIQTGLDAQATEADKVQTGLDRIATGEDRIQTGLDRIATGADRVQTGLDATATAADRVQTGLDRVATGADKTQTGLDRLATGADRVQTGLDRVATGQDKLATTADRVQTGLDRNQTGLDVIAANASVAQIPTIALESPITGYVIGANTPINSTQLLRIALGNIQGQINAREAIITAGTTAQYYRGDKTFQDFQTAVRGTLLTGYVVGTNTALSATDSILQAFGKTQGQINARVSGTIGIGQVGFGTASNTIGGSNNLFWDNVNGRLGMRTTSPANTLHIEGPILPGDGFDAIPLLFVRNTNNTSIPASSMIGLAKTTGNMADGFGARVLFSIQDDTFGDSTNIIAAFGAIRTGTDTSGSLIFQTSTSGSNTIKLQIFPTGNVVIQNGGTFTDAGFRLDVNGTARITGALRVDTRANATGNFATYSAAGVLQQRTALQSSDDILKSISGWNASVAQRLEHTSAGVINWVNI